ncbi:MAG: TSUP family transporter [Enterobacteriaceae bacterium]
MLVSLMMISTTLSNISGRNKIISGFMNRLREISADKPLLFYLFLTLAGLYGGSIGLGIGPLFVVTGLVIYNNKFSSALAFSKIMVFLTNFSSLLAFFFVLNAVDMSIALPMMFFSLSGVYLSTRIVFTVSEEKVKKIVNWIVLLMGCGLLINTVSLWW